MAGKLSERLEALALSVECDTYTQDEAALLREAAELARRVEGAPVAIMDSRDALGICAPAEEDSPALYAMQGKRVALVEVGDG